jgi:hypothetical protein
MSLIYLENIPDEIVKNDLKNYFTYSNYFNYNHIFYKIGEGNIFYPECFLYPDKKEINLYGGYCENGYYNKLTYKIEEKKYLFYREECDINCKDCKELEIETKCNTTSWKEIYEYIHSYFSYYIKK